MYQNFQTTKMCSPCNGAANMEPGDHSNGASPKSHTSRGNFIQQVFTQKTIQACILILFCVTTTVNTVYGQTETAILHKSGTNYFFKGTDAFKTALDSAGHGDTIYLSAGDFNTPAVIIKGITIIGSGHFPDSANLRRRTTISSSINIAAGADSLHLEGLYVNGDISFASDASINNVTIKRCGTGNIAFHSATDLTSKNNCCVEECYVRGGISQGWAQGIPLTHYNAVGNNLRIIRNVIQVTTWGNDNTTCASLCRIVNAVIYRNIFLVKAFWGSTNTYFYNVTNSTCYGSIFLTSSPNPGFGSCSNNTFENNIFTKTNVDFGSNINISNDLEIPQDSIFINQTGIDINYSHNYHLKYPTLYVGADGTEVGLFGGSYPFKESGRPFNPQIIEKNVGIEVLPDGTLPIRIKVQAQDR